MRFDIEFEVITQVRYEAATSSVADVGNEFHVGSERTGRVDFKILQPARK
jgi:hypothetical protein